MRHANQVVVLMYARRLQLGYGYYIHSRVHENLFFKKIIERLMTGRNFTGSEHGAMKEVQCSDDCRFLTELSNK